MAKDDLKKLIQDLDAKAKGGNLQAAIELKKIRSMVATLVQGAAQRRMTDQLISSFEASHPVAEDEKESIGAVRKADILSLADEIDLQRPRADDLEHKSMLRDNQRGSLAASAPFQRINPASLVGQRIANTVVCSQKNNPNTPLTVFGEASGTLQQMSSWVGETAETGPVAVTLQAVDYIPNHAVSLKPYARVQFGTDGFTAVMEVDIGTGVTFVVWGNSVIVQAGLIANIGAVPPVTMTIGGMLSYWSGERVTPITRTFRSSMPLGTTSVTTVLPPFARSFSVLRETHTDALQINIRDSQSVIIGTVTLAAGDQSIPLIPLPMDALQVQLFEPAETVGQGNVRIIFNLGV